MLGTPGLAVGRVEARILLVTVDVPRRRQTARRRYLPVADVAAAHAERTVVTRY